ncbi:glycosyltransferase family 2 protein [Rhodohalobacter mucosus]|uniref:Glycosyltransferase 2-like domain-containing protein n=1 Tax=Rhodohalobacter mucosus TaxID=2079485 RepID=A0A316U3L4_9BACT|nr:glycosyltransferase family A protein [Rhodohalobacter mucosus]PWN08046.1 hypothetical protein DDZ15_02075 [Rhodohalobacter mucosus]
MRLKEPIAVRTQQWPDETEPLVSIACLTYNHEQFIRDAIEGFLNQETTFRVEILIHDDASSDQTPQKLYEYESEFPNLISVIYQEENQYSLGNHPEILNLDRVRGTYIALCEGDDYWTDPLKLQKQVRFLEAHPDYSACFGGFINYMVPDNRFGKETILSLNGNEGGFTFTLEEMKQAWMTKLMTAVFRTDVYRSFDLTTYRYYRDIHLFYHLIKDHKAYYFRENFGVYRIHPEGINSMQQGEVNSRAAYNCYRELHEQNHDEFTRLMRLKSTLGFFNYSLYNDVKGMSMKDKMLLYFEAVPLVRNFTELGWLVTAFVERRMKEVIKSGFR